MLFILRIVTTIGLPVFKLICGFRKLKLFARYFMAFFEAMLLQFSFTPVRFLLIEVWNSLNERVKEFVETSYS